MKTLLFCALLLAGTVGIASAAGLNLGWLDCAGLGAGADTRTFACNTNTGGGHILVGSFVAPAGLDNVNGFQGLVYLQTQGATISPWWDIGDPPHCRAATAASFSADFSTGPFSCVDYFAGQALGGGFYVLPPNGGGANWAELRVGFAIASGFAPVAENDEVYLFKATFNNSRTVGLGGCTGCTDEVCFVFRDALVTNDPGLGGTDADMTSPALRAHVTWQGWTSTNPGCPEATPAKSRTWGSIKALYR
jgi:hypothetical protein